MTVLQSAAAGPRLSRWTPPSFLLPHQIEAARRVAGSLAAFRGALLADAVGLGKTYVALAVATRYRSVCAVVPAALAPQWRRVAGAVGVSIAVGTHESLSRGAAVPPGAFVVVDEAHRFRNPDTKRYDRLARDVSGRPLLLVTATPVVNRGADLVHLLRLFLPDQALACFGIRSLEREVAGSNYPALLRAAGPLIVARPADVALPVDDAIPALRARATVSPAPADPDTYRRLLRALAGLRYPAAGSATGAHLLRLHTYARFASSAAALGETLHRHETFLSRARQAAVHGRTPSRGLYRTLFGTGDDLQLQLDVVLPEAGASPPDVRELDAEAMRVRRAARLAREATAAPCPKVDRLLEILGQRGNRKTIVFTSAVATAHDLARRLGWRHLAVVGGGRARIASGPIALQAVLGLFAPLARGERPPQVGTSVQTLITTDLLSEGLDLQDADAVVHYDLPWTSLRLAQRIGRAARLGTPHASVHVWWFVPPSE
ncbi:MAG: DEAD/DEAH box helicase, partial [Gemmatimonadales bacterium]